MRACFFSVIVRPKSGATPVVALWRVMIPVSVPGIAATSIIVFLMGWAQFIFPLVLSSDLTTPPVTGVVAALNGQRIDLGKSHAASGVHNGRTNHAPPLHFLCVNGAVMVPKFNRLAIEE